MPNQECSDILIEEYFGIKILKDGTWIHEERPINRLALVKLLSTVLKRDENGDFWLQTPVEKGRIEVEDSPFVAVELSCETVAQHQRISFRTNIDEWVALDPKHPLRVKIDVKTGEPRPYILVREGLEARITRSVYYQLVDLCEANPDNKKELGVWSAAKFYSLGEV